MEAIFAAGFLIGMKHALEADHVAAVASLAIGARSGRETLRLGIIWGIGHSITIFVVGAAVMALETAVPERVAAMLELAVGVMLVLLGADVLRRVIRERVHFHTHRHGAKAHFHAHSHAGEGPHSDSRHTHSHGLGGRALLVGVIHGLAGSAVLVLLTLTTLPSWSAGLGYMALFGAGSILGMVALSGALAVPLRLTARRMTWAYNGLAALVGLFTMGLGAAIAFRQALLLV
jgi:ABC-type nickel/cobalt efflux system permease component RcnA